MKYKEILMELKCIFRKSYIFTSENIKLIFSLQRAVKNIRSGTIRTAQRTKICMFLLHEMKIFMVFTEKEYFSFYFIVYRPVRV